MKVVKALIVAAVLAVVCSVPLMANAQDLHEFNAHRCVELSNLYATQANAMSVAQMDDLKLCISDTREMLKAQKQSDKELKAIDKLYGLVDAGQK